MQEKQLGTAGEGLPKPPGVQPRQSLRRAEVGHEVHAQLLGVGAVVTVRAPLPVVATLQRAAGIAHQQRHADVQAAQKKYGEVRHAASAGALPGQARPGAASHGAPDG